MQHKPDCKRVFKRYDDTCPRCTQLKAGAAPRKGWGSSVAYQMRVGRGPAYAAFVAELKAHNCVASKCGPVCTRFDW
jgi:hypothetical protein